MNTVHIIIRIVSTLLVSQLNLSVSLFLGIRNSIFSPLDLTCRMGRHLGVQAQSKVMFSFFKWRRCRNNNNNSPSKRKDMLKHCRKPSTSLNSSGRSKKEVSQQLMLFCFNKIIHTILQMCLSMFLMDKQQVTVVIVFVTVNVPHASLWCKFLWQA